MPAAFGAWDLIRRGDGREVPDRPRLPGAGHHRRLRHGPAAGRHRRPDGVLCATSSATSGCPGTTSSASSAKWSLSVATQDRTFGSWAVSGGQRASTAPPADGRRPVPSPRRRRCTRSAGPSPIASSSCAGGGLHGAAHRRRRGSAGLVRSSLPSSGRSWRWCSCWPSRPADGRPAASGHRRRPPVARRLARRPARRGGVQRLRSRPHPVDRRGQPSRRRGRRPADRHGALAGGPLRAQRRVARRQHRHRAHPERTGKRHGAVAQRMLARYLFADHTVSTGSRPRPTSTTSPSTRSLDRAGFTRQGVIRRAQFRAGGWHVIGRLRLPPRRGLTPWLRLSAPVARRSDKPAGAHAVEGASAWGRDVCHWGSPAAAARSA